MTNGPRWRKMKDQRAAEALLRSNERGCMNACGRFLNRGSLNARVWTLCGSKGNVSAIIIHAGQNLLPVFCGQKSIPAPNFLRGLFGTLPVHSLQGSRDDAETLETALEKIGLFAAEKTDYDLMSIDRPPEDYHSAGPPGLVIRKPELADMDSLAALHAAYEREEVLPSAAEFNAAASRLNTERIFTKEQMLVAELDGRLAGKINTNAVTFTRFQIGGVYVHPEFRRLGIARRMAGEFTANLFSQGRGISLFVKKSNPSARRVYQRIGFEIQGDYRISYY
jgi:ribosomal protein S18 acetylase RimI-like enzyme